MNEHFKSVFTVENLKHIPLINPSIYVAMPDMCINVSEVYKLLSDLRLNPFKATGPDAILARFLKESENEIVPMFQSLATDEIP